MGHASPGTKISSGDPDTDEEASATCCTPYVCMCTSDIVGLAGCMSECQSAASILLMYLGLPNSSLHGPYWDDRSTTYRNREVDYRYRRCATMAFVFDPIKGGRGGIGPFQTPWRYGRPPARRQMVLGRAIPQHEIAQLCPYPAPLTHTWSSRAGPARAQHTDGGPSTCSVPWRITSQSQSSAFNPILHVPVQCGLRHPSPHKRSEFLEVRTAASGWRSERSLDNGNDEKKKEMKITR